MANKTYGSGTGKPPGMPPGDLPIPKITGGYNPVMNLGGASVKATVKTNVNPSTPKTTKGVA